MKMRIHSILFGVVLAAWPVLSAGQAQNPPAENAPAQNAPLQDSVQNAVDAGARTPPAAALSARAGMQEDAGDTYSTLPVIPALLGGVGISPALLTDLERANYLRAGINVGATYDDNALLLSSGGSANTSETIFPNLSLERSSARMRWLFGYAGGLTVNQKFTNENQGSHNLNFDSQYRLSPHVNLRVAETFLLTTGLFDAGNGTQIGIGSGGPNGSLITPLATQRSSLTTVESNYHFALNDLVGASGSFYDLHFSNPPTSVPAGSELTNQLTGSETSTGSAFWLHRIFRENWGGTSYRFERITFNGGEAKVHSFLAVDTLNISTRFTVTGYAGPQYSENNGLIPGIAQPSQANNWSFAGGIDGAWRNARTSVSGGYSRSISDGGGILGAVRLQDVHGSVRRELVPGWVAAVNAARGNNDALLLPGAGSPNKVDLTSVGVSLERNVGKSIGLRVGYSHDMEKEFGLPASNPTLDAQRNRFFVTLSYQWAKPLGM
jgi:hypothetical protein